MSKQTLFKVPVQPWFKQQLKTLGKDWNNPKQQSQVINKEAHRLLPKTSGSPAKKPVLKSHRQPTPKHTKKNTQLQTHWMGFVLLPSFPYIVPLWWNANTANFDWVKDLKYLLLTILILSFLINVVSAQPIDGRDPSQQLFNQMIDRSEISSQKGDHHPALTIVEHAQPNKKRIQEQKPPKPGISVPQKHQPPAIQITLINLPYDQNWQLFKLSTFTILAILNLVLTTIVVIILLNHKFQKLRSELDESVLVHKSNLNRANKKTGISWNSGGATRIGLYREENQDAYQTSDLCKDRSILVVCDGVGGEPCGKVAAQFASKFCRQKLEDQLEHKEASDTLCSQVLKECQASFHEQNIDGLTTAIIAVCAGSRVYYAALGDGALNIIHSDGVTQRCLAPHHSSDAPSNVITAYLSKEPENNFIPRQGTIHCNTGSMVIAMSDGASDHLPVSQIAKNLACYRHAISEKGIDFVANNLLSQIEQAMDETTGVHCHSDNMTMAMAISEATKAEGSNQ